MNRQEYYRQWRGKNADYVRENKKEYYLKNKENILQKSKRRYYTTVKPRNIANPNYRREMLERSKEGIVRWRNFLLNLRMEYGGKCGNCSYDKEVAILCFHHTDPKTKVAEVSMIKNQRLAREEAKKCILLCPNCHAEFHLKERKHYV